MVAEIPPGEALIEVPQSVLAQVPGLEAGQPARAIVRLGGGTVNEVFRIDTSAGRFVLRLNGPAWRRPGVERERELQLHRVAAAAGLAPAIVAAQPALDGLLLMEYQEGRTWAAPDYSDVRALQRLGERLQRLHHLSPPAVAPFDPLAVGQAYAGAITDGGEGLTLQLALLQRLSARLAGTAQCIVHGDLWQGNILQGSRLWLLDWEYAQLSDPLMDLGCLFAYYPEAAAHRHELAAAAGLAGRALEQELPDRIAVYQILSWLWHRARQSGAGNRQASPAN